MSTIFSYDIKICAINTARASKPAKLFTTNFACCHSSLLHPYGCFFENNASMTGYIFPYYRAPLGNSTTPMVFRMILKSRSSDMFLI